MLNIINQRKCTMMLSWHPMVRGKGNGNGESIKILFSKNICCFINLHHSEWNVHRVSNRIQPWFWLSCGNVMPKNVLLSNVLAFYSFSMGRNICERDVAKRIVLAHLKESRSEGTKMLFFSLNSIHSHI